MLTFSTLLIAFGTYFFKFTNNFTFGGITGLAVLIAKTGLISAGDFNFIASMILLIIGMFILGKNSPQLPPTAASFSPFRSRCWNGSFLCTLLLPMNRCLNYVLP